MFLLLCFEVLGTHSIGYL